MTLQTNKRKMLDSKQQLRHAENEILKYGFYRISGSSYNSRYFGFKGTAYKIRLADHPQRVYNPDVKAEVLFDYLSIEGDVEVRIKNAVYKFKSHMRNKVIR